MPLSPLDAAFPAFESCMKEINKLKRQMKQFKIAHDAVANKLDISLLETQRIMARFMVFYLGNYYIDIVNERRHETIVKFSNQVQVDIGSARAKMISSNEPMKLYVEMLNKWKDEVNRLGIKLINID